MADESIKQQTRDWFQSRASAAAQAQDAPSWHQQAEAEHEAALATPQRFPLTGDDLVTKRVIESGPFNGQGIGPEIAAARYRDWQWGQQGGRLVEYERAAERASDRHQTEIDMEREARLAPGRQKERDLFEKAEANYHKQLDREAARGEWPEQLDLKPVRAHTQRL
jgi:hypothetical protein